jgi:predicted alpha/beta-hydrolase family hydrolase
LDAQEHRFTATPDKGEVSALLLRPPDAAWMMVLGHGASAGMRHRGMEATARALAEAGVATLRYQFPFMERGGVGIDSKPVLYSSVRAAVAEAAALAPDLPLLAGGRSMGGRMASNAQAEQPLSGVRGLVFFGFPLHPAGKPGTERADHLNSVRIPMLFLQGEKDTLAEPALLKPVVAGLGELATLYGVPGADHSFHVPKSSGKTDSEVLAELAAEVRRWADERLRG